MCPVLSDPIGGSVTVSDDTLVPGTKAMYSCDDKHQLGEPSVRECQEDGTWSESEPTCEGTYICQINQYSHIKYSLSPIYSDHLPCFNTP